MQVWQHTLGALPQIQRPSHLDLGFHFRNMSILRSSPAAYFPLHSPSDIAKYLHFHFFKSGPECFGPLPQGYDEDALGCMIVVLWTVRICCIRYNRLVS